MENVIVSIVGLAAFGYIGYIVWRNVSGKASCNCGNEASCRAGSGCCRASGPQKPVRKLS